MGSVEKLSECKLSVPVSYNISKILRRLKSNLQEGQQEYMKILKKHVEVDEKGNIIPQMLPEKKNEKGEITQAAQPMPGSYVIKEGEKDIFKKEVEDFLGIEVEIDCHKINLKDLEGEKIEPQTLYHLEPIINEGLAVV